MRTARLYGTGDIRVAAEPAPVPADGDALIRVAAVGICGSDLHWWTEGAIGDATLSRPLVLGHEGAGVIEAGPRRGERVAIDPAIPCEVCRACRDGYRNLCYNIRFAGHGKTDGMMRELMPWPARLLHRLPDQVSDAAGALLEPLGVALHALDLGHLRFGGRVAVIGCGPIGLLLLQVLRASGAGAVTAVEPLPHRREAAARSGADEVTDPAADMTGCGADVAFEVAGTDEAVRLAMQAVRPGGRVVLGGIPDADVTTFPASLARRKGLTIAMVRRMNDVYPRAIALAARGVVALDPLVSRRASLDDVASAFDGAQRRLGLKVLIRPLHGLSAQLAHCLIFCTKRRGRGPGHRGAGGGCSASWRRRVGIHGPGDPTAGDGRRGAAGRGLAPDRLPGAERAPQRERGDQGERPGGDPRPRVPA